MTAVIICKYMEVGILSNPHPLPGACAASLFPPLGIVALRRRFTGSALHAVGRAVFGHLCLQIFFFLCVSVLCVCVCVFSPFIE